MSNSYFNLLSFSWKYAEHERKRYVLIYILLAFAAAINALTPLTYGWLVRSLQSEPNQAVTITFTYAGLYLTIFLLHWAFHAPARIMENKLASHISENFISKNFGVILNMPIEWHKNQVSGVTVNKLQKAYNALRGFFSNGFIYLQTLIQFLVSFAAIIYFSPFYGFIALLLGIVTIYIIISFDKKYIRSLENVNTLSHDISGKLTENLHNVNSIITLRLENTVHKQFLGKFKDIYSLYLKSAKIGECKWFVASLLICIMYCVIAVGFVAQHYEQNSFSYMDELLTLIGFVTQFTIIFYNVTGQYSEIIQYDTDLRSCNDFLIENDQESKNKITSIMPSNWREIAITDLNFRYQQRVWGAQASVDRSEHSNFGVFELKLNIKRGQRIAFIGESGNGKSTCLALLRGLCTPNEGFSLRVDGKQIPEWESLSNSITLISQESELFENTILYNVTMGIYFPEEAILQACDIAHLSEVINQFPNGLNEKIEEKGANLSGGQKQRLALARGILFSRDTPILLLDEPTSNLDQRTEGAIFEKLFNVLQDKTIICCVHNLDLLKDFDYVYNFHHGKITKEYKPEQSRDSTPATSASLLETRTNK